MEIIPNKLDFEIIPGILEQDWEKIAAKFDLIKPFAKKIHIDLLDGIYAPNKTFFDPAPFASFAKSFTLELHMMVDKPAEHVEEWAKGGFTRFIGQIEKMDDIAGFVAKAENFGEVGLAVDSETPVDKLFPYLDDLDFAFVMTVKAGFSNQSFLPDMLEKVKALREKDPLLPVEVDGGINDQTLPLAKQAGATRFVSTGYLFNSSNPPEKQYQTLCSLVK